MLKNRRFMTIYKGDWVIFFLILLILIGSYLFFYSNKSADKNKQVVILQNGVVIKKILLSKDVNEKVVIGDGEQENVLLVENSQVQIHSANCPDKLCEKFGWIQEVGQQIACIPHKLLIRIEGQDDLDGILH